MWDWGILEKGQQCAWTPVQKGNACISGLIEDALSCSVLPRGEMFLSRLSRGGSRGLTVQGDFQRWRSCPARSIGALARTCSRTGAFTKLVVQLHARL